MTIQRFRLAAVAFGIASLFLVGCDKRNAEPSLAREEVTTSAREDSFVDVPKAGKKFDPPIKPEQIPIGAWMCDMGTVHYATMEKGDGKCPLCKMELKQKMDGAHEGHEM